MATERESSGQSRHSDQLGHQLDDELVPLADVDSSVDHREVERELIARGWVRCGAGDWAVALRSPAGRWVARISPFDPAGPYNVALYRQAGVTGRVPNLALHRRLLGGGDLQVLERLETVSQDQAREFATRLLAVEVTGSGGSSEGADDLVTLRGIIDQVHAIATGELPWCGPPDLNPSNVMARTDGTLVVLDLFYADGSSLYEAATRTPELMASRIPEHERRFMADIPLAWSGPWPEGAQEALRAGMAAADAAGRDD